MQQIHAAKPIKRLLTKGAVRSKTTTQGLTLGLRVDLPIVRLKTRNTLIVRDFECVNGQVKMIYSSL
jgi:hypothetical protein